jgi:hypothetical protein
MARVLGCTGGLGRFCYREISAWPSDLDERRRTLRLRCGPGGVREWASSPAQAQVAAWARGSVAHRAGRGPNWQLGRANAVLCSAYELSGPRARDGLSGQNRRRN